MNGVNWQWKDMNSATTRFIIPASAVRAGNGYRPITICATILSGRMVDETRMTNVFLETLDEPPGPGELLPLPVAI